MTLFKKTIGTDEYNQDWQRYSKESGKFNIGKKDNIKMQPIYLKCGKIMEEEKERL